MDSNQDKCGFVNIIGATNVGKSTLLNKLVGQKISIISRKVQTTRNSLKGILTTGNSQIIFIDTPGIFIPNRKLDKAMINSAWKSIEHSDITLLILEAVNTINKNTIIISNYLKKKKPSNLICIINKIDKVSHSSLLKITSVVKEHFNCNEYFYLSALKGNGVLELKNYLVNNIPIGPWHYSKDQITDIPYRFIASELVREKLMYRLHQEIPYGLTVETEDWNELDDGSVRIDILIFVHKLGQKKILIGKNGYNLKAVGSIVRKELELMMDKRVHIFLYVKVNRNWDNSPEYYKYLGLDFNV